MGAMAHTNNCTCAALLGVPASTCCLTGLGAQWGWREGEREGERERERERDGCVL